MRTNNSITFGCLTEGVSSTKVNKSDVAVARGTLSAGPEGITAQIQITAIIDSSTGNFKSVLSIRSNGSPDIGDIDFGVLAAACACLVFLACEVGPTNRGRQDKRRYLSLQ
jgi:hypothetical protein